MYAASLSSNFKLNFGVHDNNMFGISANYKQLDSAATEPTFKAEKSIPLFPKRSKLPSTKRVTLKTITDTIVSLAHDAQDDLPSNSVTVLERFNVTGASGVLSPPLNSKLISRFNTAFFCPAQPLQTHAFVRRHQEVPQRIRFQNGTHISLEPQRRGVARQRRGAQHRAQ